ncbi:MAG TPA: hypothetical protein VGI87_00325 [Solirubrobacteraceae bacterium]|jgi:hypothetical protein
MTPHSDGAGGYVDPGRTVARVTLRTILPIGRRGDARAAFVGGIDAQLDALEHEAGVREQL